MCVRAGLCICLCVCVAESLPQGFRPYTQRTSVKYTVFRRVFMLAVYYIINIMHIKGGQMLQIKSRRGTLRPREFVMCTPGGVKERRADNRRTNDRAPRLRKTARCIILYRLIYLHYRSYTFASTIMFRRQSFFSLVDLTWFYNAIVHLRMSRIK
ncbi:unnamed protein product [Aphis gossypii]|uniref:Secreted protein n=1 Tax=Aphis gossypii TaxID=80765 RepID=A0A9P0NUH3_APHGO|nr:unnamed protein product [Aphis gossypii]